VKEDKRYIEFQETRWIFAPKQPPVFTKTAPASKWMGVAVLLLTSSLVWVDAKLGWLFKPSFF